MTDTERATSLGHGAIYLTLSGVAFLLAGYVTNVWLGRRLGPLDYGRYGVIITIISSVNVMQVTGVPQALSRFVSEGRQTADRLLATGLRIQLVVTVAISAVLVGVAGPLAAALNDRGLYHYLLASVLILPLYGLYSLYAGYYNGLHRFGRQATMVSFYALGKLVLVIVLSVLLGLFGAMLGFVFAPVLALVAGFRWPRGRAGPEARDLVRTALPFVGYAAMSTLQLSIDLLFVKALAHGHGSAGYYTAAQNIAVIPYYVMSAAGQVLLPSVARRIHAGDLAGAGATAQVALRYALLVLVPGVGILVVTRSQIVDVLFSHAYAPAAGPMAILAAGYGALALSVTVAYILNGAGRGVRSMLLAVGGVVGMVVLCPLLIPRLGLAGAAAGSAVPAGVVLAGSLASVRFLALRPPWLTLVRVAAATAAVCLPLLVLHPPDLLLPVVYVAALVVYAAVLLASREIGRGDLALVTSLVRRAPDARAANAEPVT